MAETAVSDAHCTTSSVPLSSPQVLSGSESDPEYRRLRAIKASQAAAKARLSRQEASDYDWLSLPGGADFKAEVEWVYQNYSFVVEERDGRQSVIHWERMVTVPPSYACKSLMEQTVKSPNPFFNGVLPRVRGFGVEGQDNLALEREEKLGIEDVGRVLGELQEAGDVES